MPTYRFTLLSEKGAKDFVVLLHAQTDGDAADLAVKILKASKSIAIEVEEGPRFVYGLRTPLTQTDETSP